MEKRKRIVGVDGEFILPEALIQHIQYFLSGEQAAQTSILSKSWYSAWSTRPNIVFDQRDFGSGSGNFCSCSEKNEFWEFVNNTVQRYEESDLNIASLRLWIEGTMWDNSLANKLIKKAMNMGATDLDLEVYFPSNRCILPTEVLGSETLTRLSLEGCGIELGAGEKVSCSRLKSLSLRNVSTEGNTILDIISSCPLIETLLLSNCNYLFKAPSFDVFAMRPSPFNKFGKQLKCLLLDTVRIDTVFFRDFSSKFPCLKDLTIHDCYGYREIQISSRSLECVSFKWNKNLRAKFVVPNIRKIKFSGSSLPPLSFKTTSSKWKSDISIKCNRPSTSWFLGLKNFLAKLCLSEISLSLKIGHFSEKNFDYARDVQELPRPVVENLDVSMHKESELCCAHLDGLFWSCRPKFITQCWLSKPREYEMGNRDLLELLCQTLMLEVREHYYIPNRNVFGLLDLEEVNVELFEESRAEWFPLPWKTLFNASTSLENNQKIRFQLTWK